MHGTLIIRHFVAFLGASALLHSGPTRAQEPIRSLGQPSQLTPYVGLSVGAFLEASSRDALSLVQFGIQRDLTNPLAGLFALNLEGYGGLRNNTGVDGGFRAALSSPYFGLAGGVDYNLRDSRFDAIFSLRAPLQRGGPFRTGGALRIDWIPTRGSSVNIGVVIPVGRPYLGRSRPPSDQVRLRKAPWDPVAPVDAPPALGEALANLHENAHWINRLTTPFLDHDGKDHDEAMGNFVDAMKVLQRHLEETSPRFPNGRSSEAEVRAYHDELDRAFSIAISGRNLPMGGSVAFGREVAGAAKTILLDSLIYPYNRLLGRHRKNDTVLGFAVAARQAFSAWLADRDVSAARHSTARYVFEDLVATIEREREYTRDVWQDSRVAWVPLQFALRPEQHDTQAELDAIVERAVGVDFTEGNRIWYIINAQFQWELWRMIREAEDYHVLWIHDYRGRNSAGQPDRVAIFQTVEGYLAAMTDRVRAYDVSGKFPTYMIFLDQHYYEVNKAKIWMDLLANPLEHEVKFPEEFDSLATVVAEAQDELRRAVSESQRLQSESVANGDGWLVRFIKVHVSITNPADHSFWSSTWIPVFGFPDNIMRDHRKLAFYDITEDDPYKGMAIYTGVGIGEHYIGPTWEDRSIMVQGPAVLDLKHAARQLLLNQGMAESDIPPPLRPKPKSVGYETLVRRGADPFWRGRAMQLHNQTGYRPKPINVYKATVYSLMPKGSVLKIPDSLWNSPFFAALLTGCSLRGGRVYVLAPALDNAPSTGFPQMSRAYELFARLIVLQDMLGDEMAAAGGDLKTGLYNTSLDESDIPGRFKAWRDGVERAPFLRELYSSFPPEAFQLAEEVDDLFPNWYLRHPVVADTTLRPKLHMKANLLMSAEGWTRLLARPEWKDFLRVYLQDQARLERDQSSYSDPRPSPGQSELAEQLVRGFEASLTSDEQERVIHYLSVGSQNQDYRGMFMDGEVGVVVAGRRSLIALIDFMFLFGSATWVDDLESLEELLPRHSEFRRRIGRMVKVAL